MTDWAQIKTEYITTDTTYRELGKKYGVSYSIIGRVASRENWVQLKQQHNNSCVTKALNSDAKKKASEMLRVVKSAGRLLDKLDKAIEELELQSVKKVRKEKVIEYKNFDVPGKPTKEIVTEEEEVKEVRSTVDRYGVKQLASALRDIKETLMLQTELDEREQLARIESIESKQAVAEDATFEVVLPEGMEDLTK